MSNFMTAADRAPEPGAQEWTIIRAMLSQWGEAFNE